MNVIEKAIVLIIAIAVMYIAPTLLKAESQDQITQSVVYQDTSNFVDTVCTEGKITQTEYLKFINELDATGLLYDIKITVGHQTVVPVYKDDGTVCSTKSVDIFSYTDEILESVFQTDGIYTLSKGDSISVTVANRDLTLAQRLTIYGLGVADYGTKILVKSGGVVRDESF